MFDSPTGDVTIKTQNGNIIGSVNYINPDSVPGTDQYGKFFNPAALGEVKFNYPIRRHGDMIRFVCDGLDWYISGHSWLYDGIQ